MASLYNNKLDKDLSPELRREKWIKQYKIEYPTWYSGTSAERLIFKRAIVLAERDGWTSTFSKYYSKASGDYDSPWTVAAMSLILVYTLWILAYLLQ